LRGKIKISCPGKSVSILRQPSLVIASKAFIPRPPVSITPWLGVRQGISASFLDYTSGLSMASRLPLLPLHEKFRKAEMREAGRKLQPSL
jgi:hypothetical protein